MTALKQMGDNDLKEMGIPMVFLVFILCLNMHGLISASLLYGSFIYLFFNFSFCLPSINHLSSCLPVSP